MAREMSHNLSILVTKEQNYALSEVVKHRNTTKSRFVRELIEREITDARELHNPPRLHIDREDPVEVMTNGKLLVLVGELSWAKERGYEFRDLEGAVVSSLQGRGILVDG